MREAILIATADWDSPSWTNKQHMAALFAKRGYRTLYVDSLGLRRPAANGRDLKRLFRRLWRGRPWPRQVAPNIWRLSPLVLPGVSGRAGRALNRFLLRLWLGAAKAALGLSRPVVLLYDPTAADVAAGLGAGALAYHCVDDLAAVPRVDGPAIRRAEASLGARADLCFVTSPLLRDKMRNTFRKVVYEPNVCDFDFFSTSRLGLAEPEDIRKIPHPRLIFVGALSGYKLDFELIETLAARRPERQWLFIGEQHLDSPWLKLPPRLPNIHILGHRPYGRLPYYLAQAEAAVLPELKNDYTAAMFPMKFFEYLAAGLPVVSTRLPALAEFEPLYFPAETAGEFEAQIDLVLAGARRDPEAISAACRHNSWEARFVRMERAWEGLIC